MNEYELMTIIHPRLNADETNAMVEAIQGQITGAGGELLSTDVWGRRRLAYPIQHVNEGTYVLMTFRLEPSQTRTIESWLGISESVLRHLLIRGIIPYEGSSRGEAPQDRAAAPEADGDAPEEGDAGGDEVAAEPASDAAPAAEAVPGDAGEPVEASETQAARE